MTLGKIKKRHEAAVRESPLAKRLAAKKNTKDISTEPKIEFRTGKNQPWASSKKSGQLTSKHTKTKSSARKALPAATKTMNGFRLGDSVKCTWKYDPSYGRGNGTFTGILVEIRPDRGSTEFFFTLRDKHGVILDQYTPMCKLTKVK